MATKPTFALPVAAGPSASTGALNAEINRVVDEVWKAAVVAGLDTPEAAALAGQVQAAANTATQQADLAAAQADLAAAEKAAAQTAKAQAEAARDALWDATGIDYWPDDGTALAAITGMTTGQKAFVRTTQHIHRYSGSAWVDQGEAPTAQKLDVDEFNSYIGHGAADYVVFTDENGYAAFVIKPDGSRISPDGDENLTLMPKEGAAPFAVTDANGYGLLVIDNNGKTHVVVDDSGGAGVAGSVGRPRASALPITAHRGVHLGNTIAPENSLDAYILAARAGFPIVECDVLCTSDGVPVLMHDDTINRTMRNAADYSIIATPTMLSSLT